MTTFGGGGCHQQNSYTFGTGRPHATFHGQWEAARMDAEASKGDWLSSGASWLD